MSITQSLPWPLYSLFHVDSDASFTVEKASVLPKRKRSMSTLLRHYETPGISPPSSRIDPRLKRRETRPIRFWDVWRYGAVAAFKGECFGTGSVEHRWLIFHSDGNRGRGSFAFNLGPTEEVVGASDDNNYELDAGCRAAFSPCRHRASCHRVFGSRLTLYRYAGNNTNVNGSRRSRPPALRRSRHPSHLPRS